MQTEAPDWKRTALENIFDITDVVDKSVIGIFRVCFGVPVNEFYDRPEDVINMLRRITPLCIEALSEKIKAVKSESNEEAFLKRERDISVQFEGLIGKMLNDKGVK